MVSQSVARSKVKRKKNNVNEKDRDSVGGNEVHVDRRIRPLH
jgi:hypothetical protein